MAFSKRHGGPYDRGDADAHYKRTFRPHYYKGATYMSQRVEITDENSPEHRAYAAGYYGYVIANQAESLDNQNG